MTLSLTEELSRLAPRKRPTVMELVEMAGVDVSGWRIKKDGTPGQVPAANPAYCYEWCFGGGSEPMVMSVWYDDLAVTNNRIAYTSRSAYRDDSAASSGPRLRRAKKFDDMIGLAFETKRPVRLIVLSGTSRPHNKQRVEFRTLDARPWRVTEFDLKSGRFVLERDV